MKPPVHHRRWLRDRTGTRATLHEWARVGLDALSLWCLLLLLLLLFHATQALRGLAHLLARLGCEAREDGAGTWNGSNGYSRGRVGKGPPMPMKKTPTTPKAAQRVCCCFCCVCACVRVCVCGGDNGGNGDNTTARNEGIELYKN